MTAPQKCAKSVMFEKISFSEPRSGNPGDLDKHPTDAPGNFEPSYGT
jgi:hypothetical protein